MMHSHMKYRFYQKYHPRSTLLYFILANLYLEPFSCYHYLLAATSWFVYQSTYILFLVAHDSLHACKK